ncbi:MAG: hypothetical protein KDE51_02020 [Anaerolineales bacterium]|nr:hypothetical protein [Anaerolineales bacterium]
MTNYKTRAEQILDELGYDFSKFTFDDFCRFLELKRGRSIIFLPAKMPTDVDAFWITSRRKPVEYIFYDCTVPVFHQVHLQLHELMHIILGHKTKEFDPSYAWLLKEQIRQNRPINLADFPSGMVTRSDIGDPHIEAWVEVLTHTISKRINQLSEQQTFDIKPQNSMLRAILKVID